MDFKKALEYAKDKHKGQSRASGKPYITHPIRVAQLVTKYKKSKNLDLLITAALLHDTLEDTYASYREIEGKFGLNVADLVREIYTAKSQPNLVGKANYLARKMEDLSSYALVIKLADRLDNICDLEGLEEMRKHQMLSDTRYMVTYLKKHRKLTKAHLDLLNAIDAQLNSLGYKSIW